MRVELTRYWPSHGASDTRRVRVDARSREGHRAKYERGGQASNPPGRLLYKGIDVRLPWSRWAVGDEEPEPSALSPA